MEEQLKHLETQMSELGKKIDHVYRLIAGEELNEDGSMLRRLKDAEDRIKKLEEFNKRVIYGLIGASIPALYGTSKLLQAIITMLK